MIISLKDLGSLRNKYVGGVIVFAGGTFDLLHKGHVEFLRSLKARGDIVVVAVSSDRRVRERKGLNRPIRHQRDRLAVIDAISYVDYALVAPYQKRWAVAPTVGIIQRLRPDIFVSRDRKWLQFQDKIEKHGTTLQIDSVHKVNSTTRIINKITTQ